MATVCGIAGVVGDVTSEERDLVRRMCDAMEHRGPDDEGFFDGASVCLGMRRLSIIDVAHGAQPVHSESKAVQAVFNGEIYNFSRLQQELRARGHNLASDSDSECLPHLLEDHGVGLLDKLRGMFALAIWDADRAELLLARDRVGKKPLYYWVDGPRLWFASELKCLLLLPGLTRDIDPVALDHYLTFQYVPAPWSIVRGVRKLPPAHRLTWRNNQTRVDRYWQLQYPDASDTSGQNEGQLASELREHVLEATRIRMVSERPVGAFLSGGLDSSAVVAAMSMVSPSPVSTFSIGFEDEDFNELPYARRVADIFGTRHHELVVQPQIADVLPKIARMFDEPFADSSAVPSYYVAEMARRDVVVVLNGDGGDESFGGYARYPSFLRLGSSRMIPAPLGSIGLRVGGFIQRHPTRIEGVNRFGSLALRRSAAHPAERYGRMMSYFTPEEKAALYGPWLRSRTRPSDGYDLLRKVWLDCSSSDTVNKLLASDVELYLPGALLPKVDITSMAVSLEARSPLLDQELMEWSASLPGNLKVRQGQTKYLFKAAMEPWLPLDLIHRRKRGFAIPAARWLAGPLNPMVHDLLLAPGARIASYLDSAELHRITRGFESTGQGAPRLWALLMLELWHRHVQESA